jgi:hypothetical protein
MNSNDSTSELIRVYVKRQPMLDDKMLRAIPQCERISLATGMSVDWLTASRHETGFFNRTFNYFKDDTNQSMASKDLNVSIKSYFRDLRDNLS